MGKLHFVFQAYIVKIMKGNRSKFDELRAKALPVFEEAGVRRSALFGSFARGEAGEKSDIDILVELPEGAGLFDFVGLRIKLEEALGRKVDLVEFDTLKPRLKERILREQLPIS